MFRIFALISCGLAFITLALNTYVNLIDLGYEVMAIQDFSKNLPAVFNTWLVPYPWTLLSFSVIITLCFAILKTQWSNIIWLIVVIALLSTQLYVGLWALEQQLMPILLTLQTLLGLLSFWILFQVALSTQNQHLVAKKSSYISYISCIAMLILCLQISLGIWSSYNSAGLSCGGFPRCQGQWLPEIADFNNGFDILNGIKQNYAGILAFNAQIAVTWLHRLGGGVIFLLLTLLMLIATANKDSNIIRKAGLVLSVLLLLETALGVFSIRFELPVWMLLAHHIGAVLLMLPILLINFYDKYTFVNTGVSAPQLDSNQQRLRQQLQKTRGGLGGILTSLPLGKSKLSAELLEDIEAKLLMADLGVATTTDIINTLTANLDQKQLNDSAQLQAALKQDLLTILKPCEQNLIIPVSDKPFVILVVGVNGAGKTTTIGKLAKKLQHQGHSVMLAAGDTFRAAAVEQLQVWGERNDIPVVAQATGSDSASVVFDALQSATAKGVQVLIADTAGRLQTKSNLMSELHKIKRIMAKLDVDAPHEVLLVLDSCTGQNALSQAKLFNEAVNLTGLALTKLDGTAKGGVIFALAKQAPIPIRYIGVGEGIDDLQTFAAEEFIEALFVSDN